MTPTATDESLFSTENDGTLAERENPGLKSTNARQYGDDNVDLPQELQNALLCLIQEAQRQDLYLRRVEVLRARLNYFYERGIQHIYEDANTGAYILGQAGASIPDPNSPGGEVQCANFINDYNIFGRCLQIIIAKLTENPSGIDWQPDSGDSAVDLQAAKAGEAYRLLYDRRNDIKELDTAIVRTMGLSGRTVTWTRTMADAQRWGTDEQGKPRRVQTTTVYGVLEAKVPILAQNLAGCPYLIITEDPHIYTAKMEHPQFADKISEHGDQGISDTQFERIARIGVLQGQTSAYQLTDAYAFYVERKHGFFRPAMFMDKQLDSEYYEPDKEYRARHEAEHVDEEGSPLPWTLRDALQEAYPEGAHATFIGAQYVASRNMCVDDEVAVDFPYAGEGMARMAVMDPAVPIQDDFNDDKNNYHEVKVVGWPSTWVNAAAADIAAINDQDAAPYCFRALKARDQMKQEDMFYREPNPEIPASFMQETEWAVTYLLQFILAIPSAVQGAGMVDQKTARGYQEAIVQAMGQLGVIWGAVKRLKAKIYSQAALAAAKESQDAKPIVIPSKNGAVTLDMSALGKGHFLAHPDDDSGFPENTVQKRATLSQILEMAMKDPVVAQALLQSPDNWDFIFRTYGIPEIVIPEARVRQKQLAEIEMLVQQAPQPASPEQIEAAQVQHAHDTVVAQAGGQPAPPPFDPASLPMRSSIPPAEEDYHPWEAEECREKLSDWPWIQQQIAAGNQDGIENIRLHYREHMQYVAQAAAQQLAMQPPSAQPQPISHGAPKKPEPKPMPGPGTEVAA